MKRKNLQLILIALCSILLGLILGYIFFSGEKEQAEETIERTDAIKTIYTCSMHPQIRQPEPGLCPICEMELIPLGETESDDPLVLKMTDAAVTLANVQTETIGKTGKPAKTTTLPGKIQPDERLAFSQVAHVPGRIEKLFVQFTGESVRKGQKLAEIYSPELISAQRELLEAVKLEDINPGLLSSARQKLKFWKITGDQISNLEKSGDLIETFTVFADVTGTVTNREVSVGDYVQRGEVLFKMVDLSRLWVLFDAYESELADIEIGDRISFTTPAVPGKTFSSRVRFIDPQIDPRTRTASIRTEVSNPGGLLKPEMFVSGTVESPVATEQALTVPASAILWTGKRSVVYVKLPQMEVPSFQFREITLGDRIGDRYIVLDGVSAGEEIVVHGNFAIDAAAQLNNQASMINRNVLLPGMGHEPTLSFREETDPAFKEQLAQVVDAYLALKDALVLSNPSQAVQSAGTFLQRLEDVNGHQLKGMAHDHWMEIETALRTHGQRIASKEDLEEQRAQFEFVSDELIEAVRAYGISGQTVYIQHCPMAFDDRGADWISEEKPIKNPYFGDRMLKCGLVTDSLKP